MVVLMSSIVSSSSFGRSERFEPEPALDPAEQRKLRGHLEQIDYAAFAANRTVVGQSLGRVDLSTFNLSHDQVTQLGVLRRTFEELTEAYDAMRRMVERGYLGYTPKA